VAGHAPPVWLASTAVHVTTASIPELVLEVVVVVVAVVVV